MPNKNIVFVFADQWRAQSVGYRNPEVKTPHIDALERESINFTNAISGCPICTPYRASLLTGQHPLTHGLFMNDLALDPDIPAMGDIFKSAGYDTAWIGKWHADGHGRSTYIPPGRRAGFDYWKTLSEYITMTTRCTTRATTPPPANGRVTTLSHKPKTRSATSKTEQGTSPSCS